MKTIAFHSNQLSLRGTEVALYDYALHNEGLLGHRSLVFYDANSPHNDPAAIDKFRQRFELVGYRQRDEIDPLLQRHGAGLLYTIKAGKPDGIASRTVPTLVHAVFPTAPWQVHGSAFAFISEWLSQHCSRGKVPCVPHIVDLPDTPEDLRQRLGIPANALVLGCHGGSQSFDVPCAIEAVRQLLDHDERVHFLFLNIAPFVSHPRARFLPGTADPLDKTRFINSCDAMLHARLQGESFGLACGEFSIRNKPVITYAHGKHTHHHDVLGDKGFYYRDTASLLRTVRSLDRDALRQGQWDCYTARYNPATVMEAFDRHLIQPGLRNGPGPAPVDFGLAERLAYLRLKLRMRLARYGR